MNQKKKPAVSNQILTTGIAYIIYIFGLLILGLGFYLLMQSGKYGQERLFGALAAQLAVLLALLAFGLGSLNLWIGRKLQTHQLKLVSGLLFIALNLMLYLLYLPFFLHT